MPILLLGIFPRILRFFSLSKFLNLISKLLGVLLFLECYSNSWPKLLALRTAIKFFDQSRLHLWDLRCLFKYEDIRWTLGSRKMQMAIGFELGSHRVGIVLVHIERPFPYCYFLLLIFSAFLQYSLKFFFFVAISPFFSSSDSGNMAKKGCTVAATNPTPFQQSVFEAKRQCSFFKQDDLR